MDLSGWRYTCPRYHTSLLAEHTGVYCYSCNARGWPSWHKEIVDTKTGDVIDVETFLSTPQRAGR